MSSARGLANHSLYMARLLLQAWSEQGAQAGAMPAAIDSAFAPGVRLHLLDAYGWFLLALVRVTALPATPPHSTASLPALAPGMAVPGEIDECRRLEREGWLSSLLAPLPAGLAKRSKGPVLAMAGSYPHIDDFEDWCVALDRLLTRMSDTLDEN